MNGGARHSLHLCGLAALVLSLNLFTPARAQGDRPPPTRSELDRTVTRLVAAAKFDEALAAIERFLAASGPDPQALFDAARVASRMGDPRRSAAFAIDALRAGWLDDKGLREHPDLTAARGHEAWLQVESIRLEMRAKGPVPSAVPPHPAGTGGATLGPSDRARASLATWLNRFGGGSYTIEEIPSLNIVIASSVDRESLDRTILMLGALSGALERTLFPPISATDDAVLLVIARPTDAEGYFKDPQQGGLYEHGLRQLVARDTGGTLRHEFVHARHHAHMARLGQRHPLWIQEALATLFEEWAPRPNGEVVLKPNLRTNEAFDLVRKRKAIPWIEFISMDDAAVMASPLDHYAQARSMLMYLSSRGKLQEWYRALVAGFATDPTGRRSLETVLDAPIGRIEADWKQWVTDSGTLDATIGPGDAVLGVAIAGVADGVRLDEVQDSGPAQRAGLRKGDVITQIDGAEIRGVGDFVMATARHNAGETLGVRFRRGNSYATVQVRLVPGHASSP